MSETLSSSIDEFINVNLDQIEEGEGLQPNVSAFIDSRRRLEAKLAERELERDIKEFDFDF